MWRGRSDAILDRNTLSSPSRLVQSPLGVGGIAGSISAALIAISTPAGPGFSYFLGPLAVFVSMRVSGTSAAALAAMVSGLEFAWLERDPWWLTALVAEALTVGVLTTRLPLSQLAADFLFWLVVGLPASLLVLPALIETGIAGATLAVSIRIIASLSVISLTGVVLGLSGPALARRGVRLEPSGLRELLTNALVLAGLCPVIALCVRQAPLPLDNELELPLIAVAIMVMVIGHFVAAVLSRPITEATARLSNLPNPTLPSSDHTVPIVAEVRAIEQAISRLNGELVAGSKEQERLRARLDSVSEHLPLVFFSSDLLPDGSEAKVYCSQSLERVFGFSVVPGGHLAFWRSRTHVAEIAVMDQAIARLYGDGQLDLECRIRRRDGTWRWVHVRAVVVTHRPDRPPEMIGFLMDIHDHKELQLNLFQSAKLITLGEMATGMAHELNQPLNAIRLAAENALARVAEQPQDDAVGYYVVAKLERIASQTQRAASLIEHMRVFGRAPSRTPGFLAPMDAISGVATLVDEQLRSSGVDLVVGCPVDIPSIRGHRLLLEQVLMNLILNGRDAIIENRERTRHQPTEFSRLDRVTVECIHDRDTSRVVITVSDTGTGIDDAALAHVFEPFFTTKSPGKGTGLGLSISYGIIAEMRGLIEAANGVIGAIFTIALPVAASDVDES